MKVTSGQRYEGVELSRSDNRNVKVLQDNMLREIINSMNNRFEDFGAGFLAATKLVSFKNWADPANSAGLLMMLVRISEDCVLHRLNDREHDENN